VPSKMRTAGTLRAMRVPAVLKALLELCRAVP
jgi:hypothetical protein